MMMSEVSEDARVIAHGEQPHWEHTFEHPEHGPLTFRVPHLPRVKDWLDHQNAQSVLTSGQPSVLGAAVAAMQTFMEVPVIREERQEDPDTPGRELISKTYYDPLEDEHMDFPTRVWVEFYAWKEQVLSEETREQIKNSSAGTGGLETDDSSPATTTSPRATPA